MLDRLSTKGFSTSTLRNKKMTSLADKHLIPRHLKLNTKYFESDFERVKELYKSGISIRQITKDVGMSRRLVQFTLFPERLVKQRKDFAIRQKEGRYRLPTSEQNKAVQKVRNRKRMMLEKLIKKI